MKPVTTDNDKEQRRIEGQWKALNSQVTTIGIHNNAGSYTSGQSVAEVAFWNHFGTSTIPGRPFISETVDRNRRKFNNLQDKLLNDVIAGKKTVRKALDVLGFRIQTSMEAILNDASTWAIPNSLSTATQKNKPGGALRGATPLTQSGLLKRSITHRVVFSR